MNHQLSTQQARDVYTRLNFVDEILLHWERNELGLSSHIIDKATRSRDFLREQIQKLAKESLGFPPLTGQFLEFGSFSRHVKNKPLDDIDDLVVIAGGYDREIIPLDDPLRSRVKPSGFLSPLLPYSGEDSFVDSRRLQYAIRDSLKDVSQYQNAEIRKNTNAVTLSLQSYSWTFDIVPALGITYDYQTISYYLIPDGKGDWIRTDPRKDMINTHSCEMRLSPTFFALVRITKDWLWRRHIPSPPSYYIEQLMGKVLWENGRIVSPIFSLQQAFSSMSDAVLSDFPDPKRLGQPLNSDVDYFTRVRLARVLSEASEKLREAWLYAVRGNFESSIHAMSESLKIDFLNYR